MEHLLAPAPIRKSGCTDASQFAPVIDRRVIAFAQNTLPEMFDPNTGLFCNRLTLTEEDRLSRIGASPRYSLIALMGLARARQTHVIDGVPITTALKTAADDILTGGSVGELGLLLWAASEIPGSDAPAFRGSIYAGFTRSLDNAHKRTLTMELAWALTGLAAYGADHRIDRETRQLAQRFYERIMASRVDSTGLLLCKSRVDERGYSRIRHECAYFAEQAYGMYALARYGGAFQEEKAIQAATQLGHKLIAMQGELGQWPWYLDARSGRVLDRYPVYSVHQYGMAPLAFGALAEVTGSDYSSVLQRGQKWLFGPAETGLRGTYDAERGVFWRSIRRSPHPSLHNIKKAAARMSLGHLAGFPERWNRFELDREVRPYELGWALYVGGPTQRQPKYGNGSGVRHA